MTGSGNSAGLAGSKASSSSRGRLAGGPSSGNLTAAGAGQGAGNATAAGQGSSAVQQVASADLPLQVDLLSLDDLPLRVSFRTDKATRPRWANQMWLFNTLGDMLNLEGLTLTLPGLERQGIREARSALLGQAAKALQAQALMIFWNVFRSYGVLGTTSKLLAVGSNITSAITGTSSGALGGGGGGERMSNVSQGIMEGGKTFGEGLLKGVTGIVADPLAGAKSGGMMGLMKGMGKGLVGVPGQIIGGALSGISKVTEGLDASVKEAKDMLTGTELRASRRRRLPRCIRGDRVLAPYEPGPALGLALLHNCGAAPLNSLVKGSAASLLGGSSGREALSDSYETHMTLPGGNVAIITNVRLLMVASETFAALVSEAERGHVFNVDAVPAGRLLWQLTWDQLLSVELAYHRQQTGAPADGIIVHRKYRSEDTDVLVHDVRCNPSTNQVRGVLRLATAAQPRCAFCVSSAYSHRTSCT
eukprot:GHRQ01004430.1.p1 GENE.GHRQ01004430.1~~GHRQ01004430.1.p1  ORF type:complete len:504 (+),score=240.28 GHRQ01004430.1:90-1514(+)